VDFAQGYLLHRPEPLVRVLTTLAAQGPAAPT
jgi:EAL domain-containing protein (putative c-di-GMP-specific phosphodiesterase class I)